MGNSCKRGAREPVHSPCATPQNSQQSCLVPEIPLLNIASFVIKQDGEDISVEEELSDENYECISQHDDAMLGSNLLRIDFNYPEVSTCPGMSHTNAEANQQTDFTACLSPIDFARAQSYVAQDYSTRTLDIYATNPKASYCVESVYSHNINTIYEKMSPDVQSNNVNNHTLDDSMTYVSITVSNESRSLKLQTQEGQIHDIIHASVFNTEEQTASSLRDRANTSYNTRKNPHKHRNVPVIDSSDSEYSSDSNVDSPEDEIIQSSKDICFNNTVIDTSYRNVTKKQDAAYTVSPTLGRALYCKEDNQQEEDTTTTYSYEQLLHDDSIMSMHLNDANHDDEGTLTSTNTNEELNNTRTENIVQNGNNNNNNNNNNNTIHSLDHYYLDRKYVLPEDADLNSMNNSLLMSFYSNQKKLALNAPLTPDSFARSSNLDASASFFCLDEDEPSRMSMTDLDRREVAHSQMHAEQEERADQEEQEEEEEHVRLSENHAALSLLPTTKHDHLSNSNTERRSSLISNANTPILPYARLSISSITRTTDPDSLTEDYKRSSFHGTLTSTNSPSHDSYLYAGSNSKVFVSAAKNILQ